MHRLTLSCLSAAVLALFAQAACAQTTNAFVSAAQPGVPTIPAPPMPPSPPHGATPAPTKPVAPGAFVFNPSPTPAEPAPALPGMSRATSDLSKAKPGQTLTAPALPNMPPVPAPSAITNIGGQPYFGGNAPQIDQVSLMEQTSPVQALKFVAEVGKTYRMKMSSVTPNLIMSPFEHPKLIMTSANAVHFVSHGSSLVVTVAPGEPVGAYITGESGSDPLIALVFEPKNLPPQNYQLQVDGFIVKAKPAAQPGDAGTENVVEGSSTQNTQRIVHLIEQTLSGSIPDGFGPVSRRHWPLGRNQDGLVVAPVEVLSSGDEILDVLSVTNTTGSAVSLEENDFYRRGVEGVAMTSHTPLMPGASVQIGILRKASQSDASDTLMSVSHP